MANKWSPVSVLDQISHGHLECPICQCRFTDPKSLKCLHTLCQQCLEKMMAAQPGNQVITCPICRGKTPIPETGITGISNNFSMKALVDEVNQLEKLFNRQQSQIFCELCVDDTEAVVRCLDCREYLCQECQNAHKRMKKTRTHNMATIDDLRSGEVPFKSRLWNEVPKCKKHANQDLLFYCETCLILICTACTAVDHRAPDHKFLDRSAAATSYKQKVHELVKKVEQLTKSNAEAELADKSYTEHKNMIVDNHNIITQKADEEVAKIRQNERLLKDKVIQFCHEKGKQFEESLACHNENIEKKKDTLESVRNRMDYSNDFDLLQMQENFLQILQDAADRPTPAPVKCLTFHDFQQSKVFSEADLNILRKMKPPPCDKPPQRRNKTDSAQESLKKIDKTRWRRVVGPTQPVIKKEQVRQNTSADDDDVAKIIVDKSWISHSESK